MKRANGHGGVRWRGCTPPSRRRRAPPHRSRTRIRRESAAEPQLPSLAGERLAFGPGRGGAGLRIWTLDGLRHSAASVLLARGVLLEIGSETSLVSACEGSRGGSVHLGVDDDGGVAADADQCFGRHFVIADGDGCDLPGVGVDLEVDDVA